MNPFFPVCAGNAGCCFQFYSFIDYILFFVFVNRNLEKKLDTLDNFHFNRRRAAHLNFLFFCSEAQKPSSELTDRRIMHNAIKVIFEEAFQLFLKNNQRISCPFRKSVYNIRVWENIASGRNILNRNHSSVGQSR